MTNKFFILVLVLVALEVAVAPPVDQKKKDEEKKDKNEELDDFGLEYGRYLQQVVQALEEDKEFAKKLENISAEQIREIDGQERVVAYWSKCLSKPERNYCVTRKELLAIVKAIEHFHHYLYGQKFLLRTDHASLTWLMNFRNTEGQVARWIQRLNEYYFDIRHRKGSSHGNADALSRRPCPENCRHCSRVETKYDYAIRQITTSTATPPDPWSDEKVREDQMADPDIKPLIEFMESSSNKPSWQDISAYSPTTKQYWALWNSLHLRNGVLYRKFESEDGKTFRWQLVLPRSRIPEVLKELHGSPTGGHFGVMKTLHRVRERFFWGKVRADVEQWCKSCDACSARKGPKIRSRGKLHRYNVGAPLNVSLSISWDLCQGLRSPHRSGGCSAALDIEIWGTSSTSFRSGKKFRLCRIEGVCELLGIDKTKTTPLHPQSDGMVERFNRTILNNLSLMVSKNQQDWDQKVPLFLLAYRSAVHKTTGYSPSQMLFGRNLRLPCDLLFGRPPDTPSSPEDGHIAKELEFVKHNVRTKLDELKRIEVDRLRKLIQEQMERTELGLNRKGGVKIPNHLDIENPHTFEIEDLKKLIQTATTDLEEIDRQRREEFKKYELEKEATYQDSLKNLTEEERKEAEKHHQEMITKHKDHPNLHHPGSKPQLEQVWEDQDHMPREEFNPKTFFAMHDINGDGHLDVEEVEAILIPEVRKLYNPNNEEDDPVEMEEEFHRMREHIFNETDKNKDSLISLEEFLKMTQQQEFQQDEGWKGLDEQQVYSDAELQEYMRQRQMQYQQAPYYGDQRMYYDVGEGQQHGVPPQINYQGMPQYAPGQGYPQHPQQGHPQQGHPQQFQQGHPQQFQQGHPQQVQGHPQQFQQGHPQQFQQGHPQQFQQGHPQQFQQGHPQQFQQGHPQQVQGHPQQFQQGHPQQVQGHPQQFQQGHPQQAHPQQAPQVHPPQPQQAHGNPQYVGGDAQPKAPQQFAAVPSEQLAGQQVNQANVVKNEQKAPNSINEVPQVEKKPSEGQNAAQSVGQGSAKA
ncbi:nucleobindin-2 [Trichonephila clavipes]|nr:nucleobindin-2 [Trichonephila clavipes]